MPGLFAASNRRLLDSSTPSFEGSHRRRGVVEIVFPASAAGFKLSLYQDPVPHPMGPELFQWSHRPPFHCVRRASGTLSTSLWSRRFVECSDGRYGGMAVDTV